MSEVLQTLFLIAWPCLKFWLVCALVVNEFYGIHLLYTKYGFGVEVSDNAINGNMIIDIVMAPVFVIALAITAFFFPMIVYTGSKRERKQLYRTPYQAR